MTVYGKVVLLKKNMNKRLRLSRQKSGEGPVICGLVLISVIFGLVDLHLCIRMTQARMNGQTEFHGTLE